MEEKNLEQSSDIKKDHEPKDSQGTKINKGLIIGIAVLILLLLGGGIYWLSQKDEGSKNTLVSLINNKQKENKSPEWTSFVSDDGYFKVDYLDNWKVLDDENLYFGVAVYDDKQELGATVRIEKIEATNKLELQEALDKKHEACVEERDNCLSVVDIEELTRMKVSGEIARIDTDSKYLSGTTIYIYLKDYYLSIYLEYKDNNYLPTFEKMVDSISIDIESKHKHYYCNREPGVVPIITDNSRFTAYCHKVEEGDTLWSIAEKYYGDPHLWEQLKIYDDKDNYDLSRVSPDDPKVLSPGMELVLWNAFQFSYDERTAGGMVEGFGLDTDTVDMFTTNRQNIYINNDVYDQEFSSLRAFFVDERTNNKIYIVIPKKEEGESRANGLKQQFVFNKQRNPYIGPGENFELLTFNHDEDKYVVRTNIKQDVPDPGFMALSNIGNGPEFDYLDSLIWYDNDTLIYRAQNDDQWRLVINHEDYQVYNYIENLRLEEGVIKFDAREEDGEWAQEEIFIEHEAYNAKLVSIPDEIPVGEEFFTYLKNTRSDLSEADLFKIEKNYHYKKGILLDEFGNLVEDPVELYLDPVPDMGMSEDIGQLTFTAKNGSFELFVYEIGPYTLSLPEGWSAQELEEINPVDFRYSGSDYKMTVSNEEYDKKAKAEYTYEAEEGDTLLSMSDRYYGYKYYWPLIVKNNNLSSGNKMPEISEGDELYMPPLVHFSSIEELEKLRRKFHEEDIEETITINNNGFSYSIDYPECWKIGSIQNNVYNENAPSYNTDIHEQWIMGPEYPVLPGKGRKPFIILRVYDNRLDMDVEEFVLSKRIVEQYSIDEGRFSTEEQENGGIIISGSSGDLRHLLFFKDDLVYDIAREYHYSMDATSQQETLDIVNSFKFID